MVTWGLYSTLQSGPGRDVILARPLFNLYINDLPSLLEKAQCDPVTLNTIKINTLMYADDTLLLSKSKAGLEKALRLMEIYCQKWQLKINTDKTKIMIFNKRPKNIDFKFNGQPLETVQCYNYLGLKISNSGSFTAAIKELSSKASRAYQSLRNALFGLAIPPKSYMKLFDILIKPIALYGCEVWGAFGHKTQNMTDILNTLLFLNKNPYELLHVKASKQILQISKCASNFGTLAELGRLPLMFNVICAICKYRARLESMGNDDLLYHALNSQKQLSSNSNKTTTFYKFADGLLGRLSEGSLPATSLKSSLNQFIIPIKKKCKDIYEQSVYDKLLALQSNEETKLNIYSRIKTHYKYETYLNLHPYNKIITKFRLSNHYLPIEKGRYVKPKLNRNQRLCTFCKSHVGDELHVLFECEHGTIKNINTTYHNEITKISNQFHNLSNESKLNYILGATDKDIIPTTSEWLTKINQLFK